MSNAIDNARKALERFGTTPGKSDPEVHNASLALAAALRELLESVAVEHRRVDEVGWPDDYGDEIETRYVTPWERA